ncbi:MAG: malectin domain-containing carbohydrate-binding protein [Candidatus Hydrogenedentes bacterium]|nr:malectin domain-containing carbohydrate-binding protein [Candidatus Hydrogenedentota bacterium]
MFSSYVARRCGWVACLALAAIGLPAFGQEVLYRLNAGGSWYTDTAGQLWEPDGAYRQYGYVGLTSAAIAGTLDDKIYQSERWGAAWEPEFAYHLPVAPGAYTVRLHFAEIYSGITPGNMRLFDVLIEGNLALNNYNILGKVGFATATVEEFEVVVDDAELDIEFIRVLENPKISGIEVLSSAGPQPGPELTISPAQLAFGDVPVGTSLEDSASLANTGQESLSITAITVGGANPDAFTVQHDALPINLAPGESATLGVTFTPGAVGLESASIGVESNDPAGTKTLLVSGVGAGEAVAVWRVNAGGGTYTDPAGNVWQGDTGLYNTGNTFSTTKALAGTANPALYRSERYDPASLPEMMYSLPVDPGIYTVNLHFAEIWFKNPNQRVFDVRIEGALVLNDFDIVAAAGAFTATVETFDVEVNDGTLNIQFVHVKENPKICGIEVLTESADLTVNPESLNFGSVAVGTTSPEQTVTLSNNGSSDVQLELVDITGADAGDFQVTSAPALPYTLPAGDSVGIDVAFAPSSAGPTGAELELTVSGGDLFVVGLSGVGEVTPPPAGAVYRINAGGGAYTDGAGNVWGPDTSFFNVGFPYTVSSPIAGTNNDALYQSERWDPLPTPEMVYSFPLGPGEYVVRLHFAEIYSGITGPGQRVFSVRLEGQPVLTNFDIYAEAGPKTALVKQFSVSVQDGSLQIQFVHGIENPKISAIEILGESAVTTNASILDWGQLLLNTPGPIKTFYITNNGSTAVTITSLAFLIGSGTGQDFTVNINGNLYNGAGSDVTHPVNLVLNPGGSIQVKVSFKPTVVSENNVALTFSGGFGSVAVQLLGTGKENVEDPYLDAVIEKPAYFIDYDKDGWEVVFMRGDLSHTHESGHNIAAYQWSINGAVVATTANMSHNFPVGNTTVTLTIWDDNVPPRSVSTTAVMTIVAPDNVPGALVLFYDSKGANPATLLDAVPATIDYGTKMSQMYIGGGTPTIVPSPFTGNVMVRMLGQVDLTAGTYDFNAQGGSDSRLFLNGAAVPAPVNLSAGRYLVDARFAIPAVSYLPVYVERSVNGGPFGLVPAEITTHSQVALKPIINYLMPTQGGQSGGYQITLSGMGYIPLDQVVVHWGGTTIANKYLAVQSSAIRFNAPAGTGTINVTVENPFGFSSVNKFTYVPGS